MAFGLEFIRKLRPCRWRYRPELPEDDGKIHFGFVAQEVDELASHEKYGFVVKAPGDIYRMNMWEFIGPITRAIQEMDERLKRIEERLEQKAEKGGPDSP